MQLDDILAGSATAVRARTRGRRRASSRDRKIEPGRGSGPARRSGGLGVHQEALHGDGLGRWAAGVCMIARAAPAGAPRRCSDCVTTIGDHSSAFIASTTQPGQELAAIAV